MLKRSISLVIVLMMIVSIFAFSTIVKAEVKDAADGWTWVGGSDIPAANYHGTWSEWAGDYYNGKVMYTGFYAADNTDELPYVEFTFTGTKVRYIEKADPGSGLFDVYIDGKLADTVNQKEPEISGKMTDPNGTERDYVWESDDLTAGQHTIKLIPNRDNLSDYTTTQLAGKVSFDSLAYIKSAEATQAPTDDNTATTQPATDDKTAAPTDNSTEKPTDNSGDDNSKTSDMSVFYTMVAAAAAAFGGLKFRKK